MASYYEGCIKKIQNKKFLFGLCLAGLGILGAVHLSTPSSKKETRTEKTTSIQIAATQNDLDSYQAQYNERLTSLEKGQKQTQQKEEHLQKEIRQLKDRLALAEKKNSSLLMAQQNKAQSSSQDGWPPVEAIGKKPTAERTTSLKTGVNSPNRRNYPMQGNPQEAKSAPALYLGGVGLEHKKTSFNGAELIGAINKKSAPKALTYLPSGTFAKARLLNGAIAPTRGQGSGNPVPILLELTDAAVMPNLYKSGVKRCFVTATATGELASERVLARLDRLSCIDEQGGAVDTKIQGYISGEDGKTGLRARLVTKSGQAIANALFTGTLAGLGKAVSLAAENQTTSITGTISTTVTNPWRAGLGEGASHAMDRITDYYLKLASDMFPVLEVDSGRQVEVVISQGLSIERLSQ